MSRTTTVPDRRNTCSVKAMADTVRQRLQEALRQEQGLIVTGIVMISPLLEGRLIFGATSYPLGAALQLPSLAATELEHRNAFTREAIADADRFAMTDYLTTLAGPAPTGEAAQAFYARIAQLTGLPIDLVTRSRGFVRDAYLKQLRENDHAVVSRYDATLAAPDPYPNRSRNAVPIRCSMASPALMAGPLPPMRATNSASRPR